MSQNRIQAWFDRLEKSLEQDAAQAGLLEHSTMIGSAREFLVKRVLRSILPPCVHFGAGKVIDAYGNASRQVDIIVFDARFPVLEIDEGIGLYPIEGVLAAIEVKSRLQKKDLLQSLENSRSVLQLKFQADDVSWATRQQTLRMNENLSDKEASRRTAYEFLPATYVFAFNSGKSMKMEGLANRIGEWFENSGNPVSLDGPLPAVPRIIISGRSIALADDGYHHVDPGADIWKKWRDELGPHTRHLMSCWDTKRRFGIFAAHLVPTVCKRLGFTRGLGGVGFHIEHYYSRLTYMKAELEGKRAWHVNWVAKRDDWICDDASASEGAERNQQQVPAAEPSRRNIQVTVTINGKQEGATPNAESVSGEKE